MWDAEGSIVSYLQEVTQGSWPEERTVHTIRDLEPSGSRESEEVLGSAAEHLEAGREQRLRGSQEWMPEADSTFSFQVKVSSPGEASQTPPPVGGARPGANAHWLIGSSSQPVCPP